MANIFPAYQNLPNEVAGVRLMGPLSLGSSLIYQGQMGGHAVGLKLGNPFLSSSIRSVRKEIAIQRFLSNRHFRALKTGQTRVLAFGQNIAVPFVISARAEKTLADARLHEADYLNALLNVADALLDLHRKGLVHADLKADNIFIKNGNAFLADFGSVAHAGAIVKRSSLSNHHAPDAKYSVKTDIYALGVMIFQYYCQGDFLPQQLRGLSDMKFKSAKNLKAKDLILSCCTVNARQREGSLRNVRRAINDLRRTV